MPIRHRTNFTRPGEVKKCPPNLEGKLRNPQCRKEVKEGQFGPIKPGPTPPTPGPTPPTPVPPKPGPTPPGPGPTPTPPTPPGPTPTPPTPPGDYINPADIVQPIVGAGLTGYGAYSARRALGKMERNQAKGYDWRGNRPDYQPVSQDDGEIEMQSREAQINDTRHARVRRLSAREMTNEIDRQPMRTTQFRTSSDFSPAEEYQPVTQDDAGDFAETEGGQPISDDVEMTEMNGDTMADSGGQYRSIAQDDGVDFAQTEGGAMTDISLADDTSNMAIQQSLARAFKTRVAAFQNLIRKPPTTAPESTAGFEDNVEMAERAAASATTDVTGIDEAIAASRASIAADTAGQSAGEAALTTAEAGGEGGADLAAGSVAEAYNAAADAAEVTADVATAEGSGAIAGGTETAQVEQLSAESADASEDAAAAGNAGTVSTAGGLEEAAGAAEAGGGGPEDPVGDVVAGGLAIAGGLAAVGQWFAGLWTGGPPIWHELYNAKAIEGSSYTNMISNIKNQIDTTTASQKGAQYMAKAYAAGMSGYTNPQDAKANALKLTQYTNEINALKTYQNNLETAKKNGQAIVSYKNESGTQGVAIQLNKTELANAIKAYEINPNVYKGVSKSKLAIMGLNPVMSEGISGAIKTPQNTYVPSTGYDENEKNIVNWTSGAGGKAGWVNFYLSQQYQETVEGGGQGNLTFSNLNDITASANTAAQNKEIAQGVYITNLTNQISTYKASKNSNPAVSSYLEYQLALFKYNNGLTSTKPTVVQPPLSAAGQAQVAKLKAAQAKLNASLSAANALLKTQQAQLATDITAQTTSQQTLTKAQQALKTAQAKQDQAMQTSVNYDTQLKSNLTQAYNQEYYSQLATALETNTAFNPSSLINPTTIYNQNAIKGTSVIAPKQNSVPTGIEFVNGNPQILASATQSTTNVSSVVNTPTTGTP